MWVDVLVSIHMNVQVVVLVGRLVNVWVSECVEV